MFGFEKLEVYKIAQQQYLKQVEVIKSIDKKNFPEELIKALSISSLSILQYFSQGSSKMDISKKKRYYTESRSAVFESVALLKVIKEMNPSAISEEDYNTLYNSYESLSRMMLNLIRNINHSPNKRTDKFRDSHHDHDEAKGNGFAEVDSSHDEDEYSDFNKLNIGE